MSCIAWRKSLRYRLLIQLEIIMIRHFSIALAFVCLTISPAFAQSDEEVAAARLLYIDGQYEEALRVLIPAAEAGNPRAQNIVGAAYQYGNGGLPVDSAKALDYFGRSAAQDFPSAHHNLGVLYENGMEGIAPDPVVARGYYEKSVAIGWLGSFESLAHMLRDGIGGPADLPRALSLLDQGMAQGDMASIHTLAYMYHDGVGVAVDLTKARELYAQVAAAKNPQGMSSYGTMLELGEGGPIDLAGAQAQYMGAIDLDYVYSGIDMAWLIFNNPETYPDQVQGLAYCFWARDAATGADADEYRASCDDVATDFTADQIADATARAALIGTD
jgi:uncharacterized protein